MRKMALVVKTRVEGGINERFALLQKSLALLDSEHCDIIKRRHAELLFEKTDELKFIQIHDAGEVF